ncbi:cytochrome b/b6 domain-containing protein [Roseovarius sp. D22-M7]|uniref:cytochrome b/b6 domain-containing protein n=1 Tax=Roseovarius sp. D22-M7 TaxID=3127116 RepID=UPI0030101DA0
MTTHKIWDPFVRLFYWSLVGLFAANALIVDDDSWIHEWVGYVLAALIVLRIAWGFIGPRYARFASFLPGAQAVTEQVGDIATRRRRTHLGHSPLGALMILALLMGILGICASGYMMTTDAFWGIEWVEDVHETLVTVAEILILLHVAAVILESHRTGINLPWAMITGTKRTPDDTRLVE